MGVHHDRLCVRVAYDPDAEGSPEFVQVFAELGPEVGVLDVVDGTMEEIVLKGYHTGAFRAEVGMVVYAIKKVGIARSVRDNTEKTAHNLLSIKRLINKSDRIWNGCNNTIFAFYSLFKKQEVITDL
jgi:hypothetical protein